MDGDNGFCGSVLGTSVYVNYLASLLPVLTQSLCHTLDRDDMKAHKDVCGIGFTHIGDQWSTAVQQ
jgi:hypothetical protein